MNTLRQWLLLLSTCLLCLLNSCSKPIKVDKHSGSPEILECKLMFGANMHELIELSSCMLQTGVIDTTTEQLPIKVAIIVINRKEIVLKQLTVSNTAGEVNEKYSGNGYRLSLSYKENGKYLKAPVYGGKFVIEDFTSKSEYNVTGTYCNL